MEIIWSPEALNDLEKIGDFIALDNPSKAFSFVDELVLSVERLENFPESGRITEENSIFRQIIHKNCRIIYLLRLKSISIVTVLGPGQIL